MNKSATDWTCTLKVTINCCNACPKEVEKLLLKTKGIRLVNLDQAKNLVHITGNIDVPKLFKTIRKIGRNAEIIYIGKKEAKDDKQMKVKESVDKKDKGKKKKSGHKGENSLDDSKHQSQAFVSTATIGPHVYLQPPPSGYLNRHGPSSYPPPLPLPYLQVLREKPPMYGDYYPRMQQQPQYSYGNEYFGDKSAWGCTIT